MFGTFSILLFISFTLNTGFFSPLIISSNSTNIFLTVLALLVYALMIFMMSLLHIQRYISLLMFIKKLTSSLILALFVIFIISESSLLPFFNRISLAMQNIGLIDNFANITDIRENIRFNQFNPKVDLFYGEASFLAIVIFASLGSFLIANKGLKIFDTQCFDVSKVNTFTPFSTIIPVLGIFILVYVQSLSSLICALVTFFYFLSSKWVFKEITYVKLIFYAFLTILVAAYSWEYILYRFNTLDQSTSFDQRFGFLFEMEPVDWVVGFKDQYQLPDSGIHNGLIYLIAISGVGGIAYFFYLIRHAYTSANIIELPLYSVLIIFAIFMQNGGIFSPGKIVLMSLVLLPLAAVRSAKIDLISRTRSGVVL